MVVEMIRVFMVQRESPLLLLRFCLDPMLVSLSFVLRSIVHLAVKTSLFRSDGAAACKHLQKSLLNPLSKSSSRKQLKKRSLNLFTLLQLFYIMRAL